MLVIASRSFIANRLLPSGAEIATDQRNSVSSQHRPNRRAWYYLDDPTKYIATVDLVAPRSVDLVVKLWRRCTDLWLAGSLEPVFGTVGLKTNAFRRMKWRGRGPSSYWGDSV